MVISLESMLYNININIGLVKSSTNYRCLEQHTVLATTQRKKEKCMLCVKTLCMLCMPTSDVTKAKISPTSALGREQD